MTIYPGLARWRSRLAYIDDSGWGSVRASPHWLELASEGQPKPPTGSAQLRRMSFWIGL